MQKLMYRVVSLMIASIFYFSAWNAALMARLLDGTGTPEKIASLMMAAFLVLWMLWVFEGHAERVGRVRVEQALQNREEAVDGVRWGAVGGVQHTHAVIGSVHYAVAVQNHQFHISSRFRREG